MKVQSQTGNRNLERFHGAEGKTNVEQSFKDSVNFLGKLMINSGQISELFIWIKCMM